MPTDNPKISLYVPQQIYDRFKEFQQQQDLSMSQAGIVILAEYFGIQETIKEITQGTTIGGVTLARIEKIEKEILELQKKVDYSNTTISLPDNKQIFHRGIRSSASPEFEIQGTDDPQNQVNDNPNNNEIKEQVNSSEIRNEPQLSLLGEPLEIEPITANALSQKRFGLSKDSLASYKRKHTQEELYQWMKDKDPDNIDWVVASEGKGYIPKKGLPSELLSELKEWIAQNLQSK